MDCLPNELHFQILCHVKTRHLKSIACSSSILSTICKAETRTRNIVPRRIAINKSRQTIKVFEDDDPAFICESFLIFRVYSELIFFSSKRTFYRHETGQNQIQLSFPLYECIKIHIKTRIAGIHYDKDGEQVWSWCDICGAIEKDVYFYYCEKCFENFCRDCDNLLLCPTCNFLMCPSCTREYENMYFNTFVKRK